jgi:8-oxo-dGTP pyrophosphatase MutT (NUDIX family)
MNIAKLSVKLKKYEQQCFQLFDNEQDYFSSAVLIPLVEIAGQWSIVFEVRSQALSWQPGEICLPGGKVESSDVNSAMTAIRETTEELGIASNNIQLLGSLKCLVSHLGVIICPHVGILSDYAKISPNASEVAKIFTVPVAFFLERQPLVAQMELGTRPADGFPFDLVPASFSKNWRKRSAYPVLFYQYDSYVIWGLTARVVTSFIDIYKDL